VLSALRTHYVGTALDFGEIGALTSNIDPNTSQPKVTSPSNYVAVQASGAYQITLSSQNGYKLKKPGGTTTNDEVRYSLNFIGLTRDTASGAAGAITFDKTCKRPTAFDSGEKLYIQATLAEGGAGKNPSPSYSDLLTVTVTPLAYDVSSTYVCGT
jgi:hypothetical protein